MEKTQAELTQERIIEKAKKYENQGFADTEYRFTYREHNIIMSLPNSVWEQNRLLNLDVNDEIFLKDISKNILFDGESLDKKISIGIKDCGLAQLHSFGIIYFTELLAPLLKWREMIMKELLK